MATRTIKRFNKPFDEWVIDQINHLAQLSSTYNNRTTKEDFIWIAQIIDLGNGHNEATDAGGTKTTPSKITNKKGRML